MPHFRSKQTLIRDIKLSAAPKLFMHHSWSLFVLQISAKQGTPKCRLCTVKIFNKQSEVKPVLYLKRKQKDEKGGGGGLFSLEILQVCLRFVVVFSLMMFSRQNLYFYEDKC